MCGNASGSRSSTVSRERRKSSSLTSSGTRSETSGYLETGEMRFRTGVGVAVGQQEEVCANLSAVADAPGVEVA